MAIVFYTFSYYVSDNVFNHQVQRLASFNIMTTYLRKYLPVNEIFEK